MIPRSQALAAVLVVSVPVLFSTCGGGDSQPTTPLVTTPPVTVPPTTLASSDPFPGATSCSRMGLGSSTSNCRKEAPTFQNEMQAAIDELVAEKPEIFEHTDAGLHVRSTGQFYVGIIEKLDRKGLCAGFDGEEVGVKNSNAFNDQYHLLTSRFIVNQNANSYEVTCYPAAFPSPLPGFAPSNPGCALPSSREITCGHEGANYYSDLNASIDQVARQTPQVFDLGDQRGAEGGYRIVDPNGFKAGLIGAMASRGYCGRHDGEEFVFKKGSNKSSEHYDLESSQGYVRRGEGTYETTCYPAAF